MCLMLTLIQCWQNMFNIILEGIGAGNAFKIIFL